MPRPRDALLGASLVLCAAWFLGASSLIPQPRADFLAWPGSLLIVAVAAVAMSPSVPWRSRLSELLAAAVASPWAVCGAAAAWLFGTTSILAFRTYAGLRSDAYDLGIFDQVVYNVARHGTFAASIRSPHSYLTDHFSPVLAALAPIYRVLPDPRVLLVVQALAMGAAVFPLFSLARRIATTEIALAIALLWVASTPVRFLATYDFHPECLAPVVLFALLDSLYAERYALAALLYAAAFTIKESTVLALAGVGLVVFFGMRRRVLGAAIAVVSLAVFVVLLAKVIPSFSDEPAFRYTGRYGYLGGGIGAIVGNLALHPWLAYHLVWPPPKIEYVVKLLLPLALLPLVGWRWAIGGLLVFAQNALADYPQMQSVHFQYNADLLPFLFAGAAAGAMAIRESSRKTALAAAAAFSVLLYEQPELARAARIEVGDHQRAVAEALARIPAEASVSADFHLAPRLTERERAYLFPNLGPLFADYVAVDRGDPPRPWLMAPDKYREAIDALRIAGYERIERIGSVEIWRR